MIVSNFAFAQAYAEETWNPIKQSGEVHLRQRMKQLPNSDLTRNCPESKTIPSNW